MRRMWLGLLPALLLPQELLVNYLGGAAATSGSSFSAPVTGDAALAVAADGQRLYVSMPRDGAVLRYDLAAKTVDRVAVPAAATANPAPAGMVVQADGSVLVAVRDQLARIDAEGRVTIPGFAFPLNNGRNLLEPLPGSGRLKQVVGLARLGNSLHVMTLFSGVEFFRAVGNQTIPQGSSNHRCQSLFDCNNASFVNGSPVSGFKFLGPWSLTSALDGTLFLADAGTSLVVSISAAGNLTVIGSPAMTSIPAGTSGTRLAMPRSVLRDAAGNLFVSDTGNDRILRRTPAGVWTVYAGTGRRGSSGDGGVALEAQLAEPASMAMDGGGTLYFHDGGNGTIRLVDPAGRMERVNRGEVLAERTIREVALPNVSAIATSRAGDLYVASLNRIYRVDAAGRVTVAAGTGAQGLGGERVPAAETPANFPQGLAVDDEGQVYFSDYGQFRIRLVDKTGLVTTFAGSGRQPSIYSLSDGDLGRALLAEMSPTHLARDKDGSLLLAEGRVRRVTTDGRIVPAAGLPGCTGYASGVPAVFACANPSGGLVAGTNGGYFFAAGSDVRWVDSEGYVQNVVTLAGRRVDGIAAGPDGSVYVLAAPVLTTFPVLYHVTRAGSVAALTRQGSALAAVTAGQRASDTVLYGGEKLAADRRGLVYLSDGQARRILAIGARSEVTVATEPAGRAVKVDGELVQTPRMFQWLPGEYHTVEALEGAFAGWSHGEGRTVTWLPAPGGSTVTARYE